MDRIKKIATEDELFSHFKSMGKNNSMSSIVIPEIGTFTIFFQDVDNPVHKVKPTDGDSDRIIGEKFELWDQILLEIGREISRPSFETWFKSTSAVKLDERHICIICNNSFQLDWIKTHYTDKIISTLNGVTGELFDLEFCVEKKQEV